MEPHWHDYLKTAKDKILSAQTYIDEIARYSTITDGTEEINKVNSPEEAIEVCFKYQELVTNA